MVFIVIHVVRKVHLQDVCTQSIVIKNELHFTTRTQERSFTTTRIQYKTLKHHNIKHIIMPICNYNKKGSISSDFLNTSLIPHNELPAIIHRPLIVIVNDDGA